NNQQDNIIKKDVSSKFNNININDNKNQQGNKIAKVDDPSTKNSSQIINKPQLEESNKNVRIEEKKSPININRPVTYNKPEFDINLNNNNNYLNRGNSNNFRRNVSDMCHECVDNFVECPNCEGYFDIEYFYSKHESFCKLLYDIYKEK